MIAEAGSPQALALGLLYFVALTVAGIGTGFGALTLFRFPADPWRRLLLAPLAATVLWALSGNLVVRFGLALRWATPIIGAVSLALLGLAVAWAIRRAPRPRTFSRRGAVCGGLVLVVPLLAWPYFARGLTAHLGSPNLDTAYYTATAVGLWHHALDSESSPLPFYQSYAYHLRVFGSGRNHTYVLLALFSPFVRPGEPIFVRNLFVCWTLLVLAWSLGFYRASWRASGSDPTGAHAGEAAASPGDLMLYVGTTVAIGWATVPALVGNWDNALFVSVGPVLAGLAAGSWPDWRAAVAFGVTAAYAAYTYPELVPVLAVLLAAPFAIAWARRATGSGSLRVATIATGVSLLLLLPGRRALSDFFSTQVIHGTVHVGRRAGGAFAAGLARAPGDPSGWWALGAEQVPTSGLSAATVLGVALTLLVVGGVVRLARRGSLGEVCSVGLLTAVLAYFMLVDQYGYAAYKVFSVASWLIGHCLVEGTETLVAAARRSCQVAWRRWAAYTGAGGAVIALVATVAVADRHRHATYFPDRLIASQPTLAALDRLHAAAMRQPPTDVLVIGEPDAFLRWSVYVLRDTPLRPYHDPALQRWVPGGRPWPSDAWLPDAILSPSRASASLRARFQTPEFSLVDLDSTPIIERVENPNGLEDWGSWLGTEPITISLLAKSARVVTLSFEAAPGPSRPETLRRTLVLRDRTREIGRLPLEGPSRLTFRLVAPAGRSLVTLSTPDVPTVRVMPNGDTRPILVAIRDLQLAPDTSGP